MSLEVPVDTIEPIFVRQTSTLRTLIAELWKILHFMGGTLYGTVSLGPRKNLHWNMSYPPSESPK